MGTAHLKMVNTGSLRAPLLSDTDNLSPTTGLDVHNHITEEFQGASKIINHASSVHVEKETQMNHYPRSLCSAFFQIAVFSR